MREDPTGMKAECARFAIEDRHAEDVGGQQVARELDALELQAERERQRVGKHGFADAGNVFDQQMAACEQACNRKPDLALLAENYRADLADDAIELLGHTRTIVTCGGED